MVLLHGWCQQFGQMEELLDGLFASERDGLCREHDGVLVVDIPALRRKGREGWWLYRLLEGYGFNADQLASIEQCRSVGLY